jgi:hypothetical protein
MKKIQYFPLFIFFILSCLTATADNKKWTVMVYLAADNNLEPYALNDFIEMSDVGSDVNINILVQLDRISFHSGDYGNWTTCHRFYVTTGMEPFENNAIGDWGDGKGGREVDTGSPEALTDFIRWGVENYPAERYAVILWNHGGGWRTLEEEGKEPPFKAVCWDDTSGEVLSMKEVRQSIENSYYYLNLIGFDACLMGMLEVATEIKELGDVMVASEETEPVSGWNFTGFLSALKGNPSMTPPMLGEVIVDTYAGHGDDGETLSAVDLTRVEDFNTSLNNLLEEIIQLDNEWLNVYTARSNTKNFSEPEFLDLYGFLYNLFTSTTNLSVKSLLQDTMDAFLSLVISNYSTSGSAYGLSIYFPSYGSSIDPNYKDTVILFASETLWKDFITNFVSSDIFSGYTQVYTENFSSGLPSGWDVVDGYNDNNSWEIQNTYVSPYLTSPYMLVDSDAAGYVDMDEELVSCSFNFSSYNRVYLKFNHCFRWYYGGPEEKGDVDIKVGEGVWQNIKRYENGNSEGEAFLDISSLASRENDVKVRWRYYDARYDWYWGIDNVEIWVLQSEPLGLGDINSDGLIDISDVILCLRMAIGLETIDLTTADMNDDGTVDISDVILILRKSIGL